MFIKARELLGVRLGAKDGQIGHIQDFYFDDARWVVRYLVADTGGWLSGRQVLIAPHAIRQLHSAPGRVIEVDLTRQQIEESPSIDTEQPVSRQFEVQYYQYYNWPVYWAGPWEWGMSALPGYLPGGAVPAEAVPTPGDPHLRSGRDVQRYSIQALDSHFGHVEDFVLESDSWALRYLVVDTRSWWPGKRVLVAPQWISWVSWPESKVYLDLDRKTVQQAPEYDPSRALTREYESELFSYYGRTPYWERASTESTRKAA